MVLIAPLSEVEHQILGFIRDNPGHTPREIFRWVYDNVHGAQNPLTYVGTLEILVALRELCERGFVDKKRRADHNVTYYIKE